MSMRWGMAVALVLLALGGWRSAAGEEAASSGALLRDPFWPVGYTPPEPQQAEAVKVERAIPWIELPVRGRSRAPDGTHRALVAGAGIVEPGAIVSLQRGAYWFHWRIVDIDAQKVTSEPLGITRERNPAALLATQPGQATDNKEKQP